MSALPMRSMRMRSIRLALFFAMVTSLACKTGATGSESVTPGGNDTPNEGADPQGEDERDSLGDLQARLKRLSAEHDRVSTGGQTGFGVCEELCDLATNICKVKESLCDLADRHAGDESYQSLCREAQHECREATESCVRCAQQGGGATKKKD